MPTNSNVNDISQTWANLIDFLPKALAFLLTVIIGWYVALFIANLIVRGLRRIGFERVVSRGGIREALATSGWTAGDLVGKLTFVTLYLFVVQFAFGFFGANPISTLLTRVIAFLPNVFVALMIVALGMYFAAIAKSIVGAALGGLSYGRSMALVTYGSIMVIAIFGALNQLAIAPEIVNGLFYSMLAVIVGSAIIAIGGGGIQPMRGVWERTIRRVQDEAPNVREHVGATADKVRAAHRGPFVL